MFSPQCSPPQESASAGNHNLRETNQRCIFALDHNWPQYLCHFLHSWRYGILFTWIHWYLVLFYHSSFLLLWFWTKLVKGPEVKWNDAKSLIIAVGGWSWNRTPVLFTFTSTRGVFGGLRDNFQLVATYLLIEKMRNHLFETLLSFAEF